jgi:hypothetical protein
MRYHINPTTGEPGKCSAKNGGCPFGGENEHFTSPEAAREAFEAANASSTFAMSASEMNAAAKTTSDHEVIAGLIAKGTPRTLGNLAKNPNLTEQEVAEALTKTQDRELRANLLLAHGGPASAVTPEDLEHILTKRPKSLARGNFFRSNDKFIQLVNNDHLTDDHFQQVMNSSELSKQVKDQMLIVLSEPNKISSKTTVDWLKNNGWPAYPVNPAKALLNGKLTEADLIDAPESYIDNFSATGPSPLLGTKEVDTLASVAIKTGHTKLQYWVAKDARTSPAILSTMASYSMEPESLYANPNTPPKAKERIAEKYADKPYVRVDQLAKRLGDKEFDSIITADSSTKRGRAYHESSVIFDMDKVQKYGLTQDDIRYMASSKNFSTYTRFNPQTGELTGSVDSSD